MNTERYITLDGNEAVARVAYHLTETIAIYPITPSSPMGEFGDEWQMLRRKNLWGTVPTVVEMQSEGGAAGSCHGMVQGGTVSTTFTASQGLLLMIPNLYKIAGELTPFCLHVTARTLATHALSIFGDHSDVMACRQTGFALIASGSVQEAQDIACIAHAATLRTRVPFLHFFDGFRTSHEVSKIAMLTEAQMAAMIDEELVGEFRARAMSPDRPSVRGTAQNPDVFFQAREAINPFYQRAPGLVREVMERFAQVAGRTYRLFDYVGHPEAERVVVLMGSGAEVAHEYVEWAAAKGQKVGLIKVRLYRPFSAEDFLGALPRTTRAIAVLDRTKEPGAPAEPLHLDVIAALAESRTKGACPLAAEPLVVGGRYGLSSKEFTPAMVGAALDNLGAPEPRNHFTVGIVDDVTRSSLEWDEGLDIEPDDVSRAVFFGLGADGTVGANKNSIKIIGEETDNYAQGYFVYDSKKSGSMTISHLRFGPRPIRSSYLVRQASFVACHHAVFLESYDVLSHARPGAVFLLNSPEPPERVWDSLPREAQEQVLARRIRLFAIDAYKVAAETGMGARINTIMQTCFFAISGVLPREEAIGKIKESIRKTYARKGEDVVKRNFAAVDQTLARLHEIPVPATATSTRAMREMVAPEAPEFVRRVTSVMLANQGDSLPVGAFPVDGAWPSATTQWEKRNVALEIPVWDGAICIQCNKCALVCSHAAIRPKFYPPEALASAPATFKSVEFRSREFPGMRYTIQVAPEDCTGCGMCVAVCPAKDKSNPRHKAIDMAPQPPLREAERENYSFFLGLPEPDRARLKISEVKNSQFLRPLFEYSGACGGCGETPYVKLLTQLFGDRLYIANATGCSSIYGANLPTTPYAVDAAGRGPTWNNSLFEDNAEFGLGMRLAIDQHAEHARTLLRALAGPLGDSAVAALLDASQDDEAGIGAQRVRVAELRARLATIDRIEARRLEQIADYLVRKTVWVLGGDGWAYDIGYGGLDHVMASGRDINLLVLDTQVYSNTGGQASKATPMGAVAKFAAAGKPVNRKDLGLMAMSYGDVYVASVAMGARDSQTLTALLEADSYRGPSLVIAYSHCIAHGFDLTHGMDQQKLAVDSGFWTLYRHDPRRRAAGQPALKVDSGEPKVPLSRFALNETRFRMLQKTHPEEAARLADQAQADVRTRYEIYRQLAQNTAGGNGGGSGAEPPQGSENA